MTRIILTTALFGLAVSSGVAQSADETNYRAKLAKPFAKAIAWELDFKKAMERARTAKKPILAYFTRSYAP